MCDFNERYLMTRLTVSADCTIVVTRQLNMYRSYRSNRFDDLFGWKVYFSNVQPNIFCYSARILRIFESKFVSQIPIETDVVMLKA